MSISQLHDLLDRASRPGLAFAAVLTTDPYDLYPEESVAVARAVAERRREFAAGRHAARQAMHRLGLPAGPIPMAADRAPIWPKGITGSISHHGDLAVAVVGLSGDWLGLGIDLEPALPLDADLINEIARPEERAAFADDATDEARRLFSAKEAAFKAQYPITRAMFGFHAMQVSWKEKCARYVDHPETAMIAAQDRARILPIEQWQSAQIILSLSAIAR